MRNHVSLSALAVVTFAGTLALPASVTAGYEAVKIAVGEKATCAVTTENGVDCWGQDSNGLLGNGENVSHTYEPGAVLGFENDAAAIGMGALHACALGDNGALLCWGFNAWGMLGDGTNEHSSVPIEVPGFGSHTASAALGWYHTCAINTTGVLYCWGRNLDGQLGDGSTENRLIPVEVQGFPEGTQIESVSGGRDFSCAVTTEGAAYCWGDNSAGQLGDGTEDASLSPVAVAGLQSGVLQVAVGQGSSCAVTNAGAAYCWGNNFGGKLGRGNSSGDGRLPELVDGLDSGVDSISVGKNHACAVLTDDALMCWGYNLHGEVDGTNEDISISSPVAVSGLQPGVAVVGAGYQYTCAITTGDEAYCWGRGNDGQLGNGTTDDADSPTAVPEPSFSLLALAALMTLAGLRRLH